MKHRLSMAPGLALVALLFFPSESSAQESSLPEGVEQILPRGRIAAIVEPEFVSADEAKMPDDAWVLGVAIDGVAKAYSLNLLNSHEVVNDRFDGLPIAAVW